MRRNLFSACLEVVVGDIVVVGFHLTKCLLMIPHQVINVEVLAFFNLVDVHLCLQERRDGEV